QVQRPTNIALNERILLMCSALASLAFTLLLRLMLKMLSAIAIAIAIAIIVLLLRLLASYHLRIIFHGNSFVEFGFYMAAPVAIIAYNILLGRFLMTSEVDLSRVCVVNA